MKTTLCILGLAALSVLTACEKKTTVTTIKPDGTKVTTTTETPALPPTRLTQANLNLVQEDMSKADVEAILGAPSSVRSEPIPIVGGTQTFYSYVGSNATVTILFKNDRVKEKSGAFNP